MGAIVHGVRTTVTTDWALLLVLLLVCPAQLTPRDMEPSRATLARYGNTSSSSIWYELDYARRHMGLRSGQKAWQIAFGSGFMCNSCVWKVLRTPHPGMFDPVSNHAKPWTPPAK